MMEFEVIAVLESTIHDLTLELQELRAELNVARERELQELRAELNVARERILDLETERKIAKMGRR